MALNSKRRAAAVLTGIVAVSLSAAACGGGSSDSGSGGTAAEDTTDYSKWCDMKSELQGKTVSIYTSIVTPEDAPHKASYKEFEDCTGVTIKYEGDKDFEKNLPQRAQSGNLPDVAFVPQPGLLQTMVDTGKAIPASKTVSDEVDKYFGADWRKYGSVDDELYAAPLGANVKSYVWYSPKKFTEKGYKVPTTWAELMDLTAKIATDDPAAKPWCAGFSSGHGHRLAGHRLARGCAPAYRGQGHLRPVGRPQDPLQRPEGRRGARPGRRPSSRTRSTSTAASVTCPPSRRPPSRTAASRSSRASATCTARPRSTPPTGPMAPRSPRTATSGRSTCRRSTPRLASRSSVVASSSQPSVTAPEVKAFAGLPGLPRLGQRQGEGHDGRRLGQRQQGARPGEPGLPDRPAVRQDPPGSGGGVPVRRLGHDAVRGRCRHLLVGDDQLGQGSGRQDHPRQHREVLAGKLTPEIRP
jgi:hypothetical protein